jgi:hypothetical protein
MKDAEPLTTALMQRDHSPWAFDHIDGIGEPGKRRFHGC